MRFACACLSGVVTVAPARTPKAIVDKLNVIINQGLSSSEVQTKSGEVRSAREPGHTSGVRRIHYGRGAKMGDGCDHRGHQD
jgi:hypothetical protein